MKKQTKKRLFREFNRFLDEVPFGENVSLREKVNLFWLDHFGANNGGPAFLPSWEEDDPREILTNYIKKNKLT